MSSTLDTQHDLAVEKAPARAAPPPMYQVLLLNDDYTPMEFVVKVLQKFFNKNHEDATRIMLQVHHEGRGVCGVYPRDVAATRIAQVAQYARARQHPLQCVMEPVRQQGTRPPPVMAAPRFPVNENAGRAMRGARRHAGRQLRRKGALQSSKRGGLP